MAEKSIKKTVKVSFNIEHSKWGVLAPWEIVWSATTPGGNKIDIIIWMKGHYIMRINNDEHFVLSMNDFINPLVEKFKIK